MKISEVIKEAEKLVSPSRAEEDRVHSVIFEVTNKVAVRAKAQNINAHLIAGGSAAKGTWLPGFSDIDFFLVFDYDSFSEKSAELSNHAEKILKGIFKLARLHGSRDYFSAKYKNYNVEIIPVLDISEEQEPRNLTDFSPLHVTWFNIKAKKNPKLRTEVRLAKQFLKAAGVYGAESYIRGFSGHVVEILVANYGSFLGLAKSMMKWKYQEVVDVERHYRNAKEVFANLNKSKLESAIILVDPVEKGRNAAAALDRDKFNLAKEACHRFMDMPGIEFFKEKQFSIENLKEKKKDLKLIIAYSKIKNGKPDIIGAKLRKEFEQTGKIFAENDFVVQDSGFHIDPGSGVFWFYFDKTALSAKKEHAGPPANLKDHASAFKKKWKAVKIKDGRLVAEVKRKYIKPEELLKKLKVNFKVY